MWDFYFTLDSQHFQFTLVFLNTPPSSASLSTMLSFKWKLFHPHTFIPPLTLFNRTYLLSTTMWGGLLIQGNRSLTRTRLWYHCWKIYLGFNMREHFYVPFQHQFLFFSLIDSTFVCLKMLNLCQYHQIFLA